MSDPVQPTPDAAPALPVRRDRVVSFHYEMRTVDGEVLERNFSEAPTVVLYGRGGVIKGLEAALLDQQAGAQFTVDLPPEQAFGLRDDSQVQRISKKYFPKGQKLAPGTVTALRNDQGVRPVTVLKVGRTVVDVDLNHPRAGLHLIMDVRVESVREATSEERAHGHAHGPGGHQH